MHSKSSISKKSHGSKHKSKKTSKSNSNSGTPEEGTKDKNYKSYAGFTPKSIKSMWEQHERSNETEVSPEAIQKVSEDVTYKLWEVMNSIKTFATKSSGRVTVDLVNDVLKDCNVDPIVGASSSFWDRIEYDGTYFFNYDEVIDLQEEYSKDIVVEEPGPVCLNVGWLGEPNMQQELIEFYGNLVDAIYLGEQELLQTALDMIAFNPYIASISKLLLSKCIELLAYDYTTDVLQRSLKLLNALTVNPATQNGLISEELAYLSQIFEGLLLGSIVNLTPQFANPNSNVNQNFDIKMDISQTQNQFYNTNGNQFQLQQPPTQSSDGFVQDDLLIKNFKPETYKTEEQAINAIKKECEDFLMMMDTNEIVIKKEEQADLGGDAQLLGGIDELPLYTNNDRYNAQDGPEIGDDVSIKISEVSSEPEQKPDVEPKVKLMTLKCDFSLIEEVCRTIGLCAGQWGLFEQHLTYRLSKRVDILMENKNNLGLIEFYETIFRLASGLWSLGEYAFRDLTVHLDKIDPQNAPDYLVPIFNRAAIFLQGKKDVFFYEWLQDMCANAIQGFMAYYPNYLQKYSHKMKHRIDTISKNENIFSIPPQITLVALTKGTSLSNTPQNCSDIFENYKLIRKPDKKKFNFRVAGCRPVNLRSRKLKLIPTVFESIVVQKPLDVFNSRITVAKRKLLKPVTNAIKRNFCANYHWLVF